MSAVTAEDRALMEEAAEAVVKRRLAVPAMMFLETVSPMNTVTASMLHMITPIWGLALPAARLQQVATMLERRETIPEFIRVIDEQEERRRRDETAAKRARKEARRREKEARRAARRPDRDATDAPAPDDAPTAPDPDRTSAPRSRP